MSLLSVVVIVGVVAAIATATLSDGSKPATRDRAARRARVEPETPSPAPPPPEPALERAREPEPVWADDPPSELELAFPERPELPDPPGPWSEPDDRRWGPRLRSAGLLGLTVSALGAVAAATIGAVVVFGSRFLDRALG